MVGILVALLAVVLVAGIVWGLSPHAASRGKHGVPGIEFRDTFRVTRPPEPTSPSPAGSFPFPSQADEKPPRSISFLRIALVIVLVALAGAVLVWMIGFLLNLQLERVLGP